jgi:hypothetical protein
MIREYAVEIIDRMNGNKKIGDFGYTVESTENKVAWIIRSFGLRHKKDVEILNKIFSAYGLDFDFSEQADRANYYFKSFRVNNPDLCHVTVKTCLVLADKVSAYGFDKMLDCIPEKA